MNLTLMFLLKFIFIILNNLGYVYVISRRNGKLFVKRGYVRFEVN